MTEEKKSPRGIDIEEFIKFVEEFKGESDRAAVILGAAKIGSTSLSDPPAVHGTQYWK